VKKEMQTIGEKIVNGKRLNRQDGQLLMSCNDLTLLAALANHIRRRIHPENTVTYIIDRNINYTNICSAGCSFCAFHHPPESKRGYVLSRKILAKKIDETKGMGGVQILIQGGLNPDLSIEWFEDLFRWIKSEHPIHIHGLSPPEILYIAKISRLTVEETLMRLISAGLDSIPGGGAEILMDSARRRMNAHIKATSDEWLDVMRTAHRLGLLTTATMMFGAVETAEERLEHLFKIRDLQDESTVNSRQSAVKCLQSGGYFTAFIPWVYQPVKTRLGGKKASSYEYLKMVAISRIILDNIPNIQASWVTQGDRVSQLALHMGCNDLGSTMIEENVVAATGVKFSMSPEKIEQLIRAEGFIPVRRNQAYALTGP
jgi:cyclic dehypoxanthinyl futalosine synthase